MQRITLRRVFPHAHTVKRDLYGRSVTGEFRSGTDRPYHNFGSDRLVTANPMANLKLNSGRFYESQG